jgi:hypothetical protein
MPAMSLREAIAFGALTVGAVVLVAVLTFVAL